MCNISLRMAFHTRVIRKATFLLNSTPKSQVIFSSIHTRGLRQAVDKQETGLLYEVAKNNKHLDDHDSVVDLFLRNKLYEDDFIIAFNKPNGYSIKVENPSGIAFTPSNSLIHALRDVYRTPKLSVALPLSKDQSGVVIFAKDFDVKEDFYKNYVSLKSERVCFHHYKAVCLGLPKNLQKHPSDNFMKSMQINGIEQMVPLDKAYKKERKHGGITFYSMKCEVASKAASDQITTSLVNLSTNSVHRDACKVFLTKKLSPILGDHSYGCRVSMIRGHPIYVPPERAVQGLQRIPVSVLQNLGVLSSHVGDVPLHLHRSAVDIIQFPFKKSKRHTISAPVPDFFKFTLDKLNLNEDDSEQETVQYS